MKTCEQCSAGRPVRAKVRFYWRDVVGEDNDVQHCHDVCESCLADIRRMAASGAVSWHKVRYVDGVQA